MNELEILGAIRRAYVKVNAERESGRIKKLQDFRDAAKLVCKKSVSVRFGDTGRDLHGSECLGSSGASSIVIHPELAHDETGLCESVFVHELSHVGLGHSGEGTDGTHGRDLSETVKGLTQEQRQYLFSEIDRKETEAHELAGRLTPLLFGKRYQREKLK